MPFYAVAIGRVPGIYQTWDLCKEQVHGFKGAKYKKFDSLAEAESYRNMHGKKSDLMHTTLNNQTNLSSHVPSLETVTSMSQLVYVAPNWHVVDLTTKQTCPEDINGNQNVEQLPYHTIPTEGSWLFEGSKEAQHYVKNDIKIVYVHAAFEYIKCVNKNWKEARAGIGIYWPDNQRDNVSTRLEGKASKSRADIQSAIMSLQIAKHRGYKFVTIRTESKYLLKAITDWIHKWIANGWMKKSNSPVKDREDFVDLLTATEGLEVDWEETRACSVGHTMAKQLATEGLNRKLKF